jgi:hypothetical protein
VAAITRGAERLAGGQAHAQSDLGRHGMAVGLTPDAIGAEIGALSHEPCLPNASKRSVIEFYSTNLQRMLKPAANLTDGKQL